MSDLLDIQEKIQDTNAMIARMEGQLAAHPNMHHLLAINLQALHKRKGQLESQFGIASSEAGVDVCSYRFLPEHGRPKLAGLARAMLNYQKVLSIFYDAIKSGPKQKAKMGADILTQTALEFAYAFPGSIGFVFTIPNERLMLIESGLDEAVRTLFEVARAAKPADILEYAKRLGPAPIRTLYEWADGHVKALLSAEIEWRRGQEVRMRALIQRPEFERLQLVLSETSEETQETLRLTGVLLGGDAATHSFHFDPDIGGGDIRGGSDIFDPAHPGGFPKRYMATIRKTTQVKFSTEQDITYYDLLRLEPF